MFSRTESGLNLFAAGRAKINDEFRRCKDEQDPAKIEEVNIDSET